MNSLHRYAIHAQTSAFRRARERTLAMLRDIGDSRVLLSTSWGKDSLAMLSAALGVFARIDVVHLASSYAIPIEPDVRGQWGDRITLHELPAKSLDEVVATIRSVGLPHERTVSRQVRYVARAKKAPLIEFARSHGYEVVLIGLRSAESTSRTMNYRVRGHLYTSASGLRTCTPIVHWSHADVWAEIVSRGITYPSLYDKETHGFTRETIRNAGWLSTDMAHKGRMAWLRAHWPHLYAQLKRAFPQVGAIGA